MSAELDRQVAEAIGFRRKIQVGPMSRAVGLYSRDRGAEIVEVGADDPRMPQEVIPKYSTDLNAAFEAAEKVGLWDYEDDAGGGSRLLLTSSWGWSSIEDADDYINEQLQSFATGKTPALAICNAIIALKETEG